VKHLVGFSRNGIQVYAQLIGSQAGMHIARQPQLLSLANEMLAGLTLAGQELRIEHDLKRLIGYNFTVETTDDDVVFYGCLLKDNIYTRFVKNTKPLPTRYLTAILTKVDEATYELADVWIGRLRPPRPGSPDETPESKPFWSNHALIMDGQPLQLQTVTKTCPY